MRHMGRAADSNQCPGNAYRYVGPSSQLVGSRTAVTVAAASTAPELTTSIQSRPLQANPSHPLLWNTSTGSNTGTGSAQTSLSRQRHAGFTSGFAAGDSSGPVSSSASALSTPSSSFAFAFSSGDGRPQRQSTHDGCVGSSRLSSCATAHVLRPRRRSQGRIPPSSPSSSAPVAGLAAAEVGNAGVPSAKVGKERTVTAVNYNALFHKELQRQESHGPVAEALMSSSSLSPSPGLPTGGVPLAQLLPSDRAVVHGTGAHNGFLPPDTATPPLCVTASLEFAGTVEGPLPPEVRRIIAQSCPEGSSAAETNAIIDAVEQQARRLISTGRRVKVFREELTAAEEERRDLSTTVEERHLVRSALQGEVDDINARIAALLQERGLVEAQLNAQNEAAARDEHKLTEAQNRVTLLRKTIDGIAEETMVARLMLRQQSDFGDVETELRDIEETFANGRMNAFGSAPMQDAFVHELKRIAEIETQVFYRTCALLKTSSTNGHKLVTNMYASAQPPPQSQRSGPAGMPSNSSFGDGSFRASGSGMESSSYRSSMSQSTHLPSTSTGQGASSGMSPSNGNVHSTFPSRRRSHQASASFCASSTSGVAEAGGSLGAAPHISQNDWGNENGFADKAFEDVAAHFEELESQFFSLGDHLRDISKHVTRLNDMSKQLNTTTSYGVPTTPGATATVAAKNISENSNHNGVPPKSSTLGRQDHAIIIDGGDGSH